MYRAGIIIVIFFFTACIKEKTSEKSDGIFQVSEEFQNLNLSAKELIGNISFTKVDGSKLTTTDIKGSDELIGSFHALKVTAKADENADYMQLSICTKDTSKLCKPNLEEPEEFLNSIVFSDAPSGLVDIMVRSCVRPENAINPLAEHCGPWQIALYKQAKNSESKVKKLLLAESAVKNSMRDKCANIHENIRSYKQKESSSASQEFQSIVDNIIAIGRDLYCEVLINEDLDEIEDSLSEPNQVGGLFLTDSRRDLEVKMGFTAIALGSAAIFARYFSIWNASIEVDIENHVLIDKTKKVADDNVQTMRFRSDDQVKDFYNHNRRYQLWNIVDLDQKRWEMSRELSFAKEDAIDNRATAYLAIAGAVAIVLGALMVDDKLFLTDIPSRENVLLTNIGELYSSIKEEKQYRKKLIEQIHAAI